MNPSPPPELSSDTSIKDEDSPVSPKSNPRRFHPFLSAYTGAPITTHTVSTFTRAQVQVGVGGKDVTASQHMLRGTVVGIEGDKCFRILKALSSAAGAKRSRDGRRALESGPNCAMSALHHQLPSGEKITLRIVVTTTQIRPRDVLVLCPHSVTRCVDEPAWYQEAFQPLPDTAPISHWPREVPYYHGIGEATRSAIHPPRVGFPYSLLSLQPSSTLGAGEMEVVATAPIPSGTCFEYTGELADVDSNTPSDGVYSFQLRDHQTVEGSGITRYINHRFRFHPFGNLQFSQACLPNTTDSKRLHDGDSRMIVIPFFITTRDVHPGEQLLATSYGDVYDAQLERDIFRPSATNPLHNLIPCGHTPVLDHAGAYRWAVGLGDIVHIPEVSRADITLLSRDSSALTAPLPPSYGLLVVEGINETATMVLLRPMKDDVPSSTMAKRPVFEPNPRARTVVCHVSHLSLLAPHTDFDPSPPQGPIKSISLSRSTIEALSRLHPTRTTNALLCGSYWSMVRH